MKTVLVTIGQAILVIFFGFLARETWRMHGEEQRKERISKDGIREIVKLDDVSNDKKTWRDHIGNSRYISFHYKTKAYAMRYTQDSVFLQNGALVPVIYSPLYDDFIQPVSASAPQAHLFKTSPLIQFTAVRTFSRANALLFFAVLLTAVFLVFSCGFLAGITRIKLFRFIGNTIAWLCALSGSFYVTYNALAYWRYYEKLHGGGTHQTVKLEDLSRTAETNGHDNTQLFLLYNYEARVNFRGESRIIAAGKKDYEHLHAGDDMDVIYSPAMDDMMSAKYGFLYRNFIFALATWVIVFFAASKSLRSRRKSANTV